MSNTDSFIEEVTEEVRRDRLFAMMKKYGWIAVLVVVLIVGGASWNEYTKARTRAASEALGDAVVTALDANEAPARAENLAQIETDNPGGAAVVAMLQASALQESGDTEGAIAALETVAVNGDLEPIYRNIAAFKALVLRWDTADPADLRVGFEALAQAGSPLRLLAEEQLALLDIRDGQTDAAIERLQAILDDAELSADLQQRAAQAIVALGGEPRDRDAGTDG